ncbi:MAG TPA: dihydroxyacetone kinase subunit DhaK [Anaerolineales bacterium]|nr:dihydroxyacetone kinase subunit DhaK [Anaerolineales bacterium]
MKKLINRPKDVVKETIEGFLMMHATEFKQVESYTAIVKTQLDSEKVGLVIGGGSGHEPLFLEFIGKGYADAVAMGNVFAAPSPDVVLAATKAVDRGRGVLYVYGNYAGDNLNFDMGAELADFEGIRTETVRVWDDVASAPLERISDRRGIAGDFFVIKVAGAACDAGLDLDEVKRLTIKVRDNTRTMGVALYPGTIPGESVPSFTLPEDEMEIGMGLHGEPGVRRGKMRPADEVVDEMLELIIRDLPFNSGDQVCVLVNGFGASTRMELLIAMRRTLQQLEQKGMVVYRTDAGNYATCQEMAGVSITLMRVDDELKKYIDWPVWSPVYKNGVR